MSELRSHIIMGGDDAPFYRSLFKSMGYTDYELDDKPIIGIANTWNTVVPGHFNLNQVAEFVKKGVYSAGGTVVEFGVIGACDGVAQGHIGMNYILPSREIICNSIEIMAQAHRLDAVVLLASCDKIVPGVLMAAARLDIPAIVVMGGPGMREMFKAMKFMYGAGLSKTCALITDGRFSGTNNGCFVGHISPEAAEGGPLAIVKDGDEILIDVNEGKLELHVLDEEIAERFKTWKRPEKPIPNGYLRLYSKVASSADKGAIIEN